MKNFKRKKNIVAVFTLLLAASVVCADEIELFSGEGYNYNDFLESLVDTTFSIIYDTESDEYYFYTADFMYSGWIVLDATDLDTLSANLLKYKEWEKLAIENQVKIEKELPNSKITTNVIWKFGSDWYSADNIMMAFIFFSQSESQHQLVIHSSTTESSSNQFIDYTLDSIYLTSVQVDAFAEGLSPESIDARLEEYSDLQKAESLFQ